MLDLISQIKNYLPWIAFVSGLAGSLHCVGMCGGLVAASTQKSSDIFRYQLGRLIGYLIVGFFAGLLGNLMKWQVSNPKFTLIPGILMGLIFIYWGVQNFRGKQSLSFLTRLNSKFYFKLMPKINTQNSFSKSFFTGLFSIFLPCGLLYGVVLGIAAFHNSLASVATMFFFWLGTLPAMMTAPSLVHKFLHPIKAKLPRTYALTLIAVGLMTISYRVISFQKNNHTQDMESAQEKKAPTPPSCH